ncbi:MAG: SGNH/GDSL hydrolase family protein [Cyclobacteriaceae bacterium]
MSCQESKKLVVDSSDPSIAYASRIELDNENGVDLYWSGASVKITYEGEAVYAWLQDESGDNYFNVVLDGDSTRIIQPGTTKTRYLLADHQSEGRHSVELFKRTEWDKGKTTFFAFEIAGHNPEILEQVEMSRKIEFYGNSISAGYAVDDLSGKDSPDSIFTNAYVSYPALVSRALDAEFRCICKSGIGVMVSWFPLIMPELFERLNPADTNSRWDFTRYQPDLVVVNLLQNDSWIMLDNENEEFRNRFGDEAPQPEQIVQAYASFVSKLRGHYPDSHIICMLGNMDITKEGSPWPEYVQQAVEHLDDPKIHTHFVSFKGRDGHPSRLEQQQIALSLTSFIKEKTGWQ